MNPLNSAERREIDRHFRRNRGSERRDQQNRTGDQISTAIMKKYRGALGVPAKDLIRASRLGGITLVLGSGISVSRGLPDWNSLAQDLWRVAFGRRRSPWQTTTEGKSPLEVAQFLPIVFELAQEKLGKEKFLKAQRRHHRRYIRYRRLRCFHSSYAATKHQRRCEGCSEAGISEMGGQGSRALL
jgi:hypothetical protein